MINLQEAFEDIFQPSKEQTDKFKYIKAGILSILEDEMFKLIPELQKVKYVY